MSDLRLIERERELLARIHALIAARAESEVRAEQDWEARTNASKTSGEQRRREIVAEFKSQRDQLERDYRDIRKKIKDRASSQKTAARRELTDGRNSILKRSGKEKEKAKNDAQESRWTIAALFDAGKAGADRQFKEASQKATQASNNLTQLRQEAGEYLEPWKGRLTTLEESPAKPTSTSEDTGFRTQEAVSKAANQLESIRSLLAPRIVTQKRYAVFYLLFAALAVGIFYNSTQEFFWLYVGAGVAIGFGLIAAIVLWLFASRQIVAKYGPFVRQVAEGEALVVLWQEQAKFTYDTLNQEIARRRDEDSKQTQDKYEIIRRDIRQRRNAELAEVVSRYKKLRAESKLRRAADSVQCLQKYKTLKREYKEKAESELKALKARYLRERRESNRQHEADWAKTISEWTTGMAEAHAELRSLLAEDARLFSAWEEANWQDWIPTTEVPPVIRFGQFHVDLAAIPNGIPTDPRLAFECPPEFDLPAYLDFPKGGSVLFKASDEGRAAAVAALQSLMMRLITAVPPAKTRFTILDPVGLGENFATFMHLADHDELLITNKIWTEQIHMEQRLIDLTAHMEVVIQKYLRNQFESIEEYNSQAGEVAEPFRILVVANFPVGFTPEACRRLISIVSTGARCGVHALITVDTKATLPQGLQLADLEAHCTRLSWKDGKFVWHNRDFQRYPLTLDPPPEADLSTRVLQRAGELAKSASRVEVPFDFIAPAPEQWWKADTRSGINVALGRAGATKRQFLRLGQGTSQHVLVAGKTGSGKSTLLHALITNLALSYSPDEIELYLIDFKKGVEFKMYATEELPHARVIAIESEREFGLSVLQRLDAELKQRGERFRQLGVQDLAGFRLACKDVSLPRIMLIVDEFQEFFVEDDKIAQDSSQLLDRLVRQGRAFGLHVMLGSQTLGGAYSLARSTVDQMAVRIALQCSEADGHLILSEDNSAARLLSRPGEAIYNDANGLVEGNNPFQVVWLSESRRENYLHEIRRLERNRDGGAPTRAHIVFEGNAPADIVKNHLLQDLLKAKSWPAAAKAPHAWMGEALAIKDPTAAIFRPHSGSNLLILGQHEEMALGILATTLVSLAAQLPPSLDPEAPSARVYVLDGTAIDSPHADFLSRLAESLTIPMRVGTWRDAPAFLAEATEEIERRQKLPGVSFVPWFLVVHGIQRFRDLRKQEDDFGFGRKGEGGASVAKLFATALREGAGLGVHSLVWCDSLNSLTRALDRQGMREFEMRVLFQMSVADSSTVIDTPIASKLGINRALFASEDQGKMEKFRPYGIPSDEWLEGVRQALCSRSTDGARETPQPEPVRGST